MRIYTASNWASQARIKIIRTKLEALGHYVCSGWLDETDAQSFEALTDHQRQDYSYRDLGEIVTADLLIIDTNEQSTSGGREIEYGVALALGKPVWHVGPYRNIFHTIAREHFDDWSEVFAKLVNAHPR